MQPIRSGAPFFAFFAKGHECPGRSVERQRARRLIRTERRARGAVRRALQRGLTLVELVIVITIIGVLTAAISIGVMAAKKRADVGTTQTACNTARNATVMWKNSHPSEDCPTIEQLKQEKFLGSDFSVKDPWGNPLKLACDADEITCTTAGPDRKEGTDDDIQVPKADNTGSK